MDNSMICLIRSTIATPFSSQVKIILLLWLHEYSTYIWETETLLGLFVPYFDSYMVIHGNLYARVTLVSKKTKTNKNNRVLWANLWTQ